MPIYAVFDDLASSLCPVCIGVNQSGCSMVAVHPFEYRRIAELLITRARSPAAERYIGLQIPHK